MELFWNGLFLSSFLIQLNALFSFKKFIICLAFDRFLVFLDFILFLSFAKFSVERIFFMNLSEFHLFHRVSVQFLRIHHIYHFFSELSAFQFFRFFGNFFQSFSDFNFSCFGYNSLSSHFPIHFFSSFASVNSYSTNCIPFNLSFLCFFFSFPNHHIIPNTKTNKLGEPNMSTTRPIYKQTHMFCFFDLIFPRILKHARSLFRLSKFENWLWLKKTSCTHFMPAPMTTRPLLFFGFQYYCCSLHKLPWKIKLPSNWIDSTRFSFGFSSFCGWITCGVQ